MATLFIDDEMAVVALYTDYQYKWMLNSLDEAPPCQYDLRHLPPE